MATTELYKGDIGIELDPQYFEIAKKRIEEAEKRMEEMK